jgi:hypothetical protein
MICLTLFHMASKVAFTNDRELEGHPYDPMRVKTILGGQIAPCHALAIRINAAFELEW